MQSYDPMTFDFDLLDFADATFETHDLQMDLSTTFLTGFELLDHALAAEDYAEAFSDLPT